MTENTKVIVVGGGYAGVMAANRLAQHGGVKVTLINPRPEFVERVRLHQLVAGSHTAILNYEDLLAEQVRLIVDTATRINPSERRVKLVNGGWLLYDYLVYAVGSHSAEPSVPGVAEFAHRLASVEEADRLRPLIESAPLAAQVTIVGAGPTGIETAAELAETGREVTLVCGEMLGPYLHPRSRISVRRQLASLGVRILEGSGATVASVADDAVQLDDGRELSSQIVLWTAGFTVPELAADSGLSTDPTGRLLTDETLTSIDDARVVAAGDAAAPSGAPLRMSCQAAIPLGKQAAETVLSRLARTAPAWASVGFVGQALSLGRRTGLIQFAHRDDTVGRWFLRGRPAAMVKELICSLAVQQLISEARRPGLGRWLKVPRSAQSPRSAQGTALPARDTDDYVEPTR